MSALKTVLLKNKTYKGGSHPVMLRIYFGKQRYISLGIACQDNQWNAKAGKFNSKMPNHEQKNAILRQKEAKADKIIQEMLLKGKPFSFDVFKTKFLNKKEVRTVSEFLEKRLVELQDEGSVSNMLKYRQLKNTLKEFKGTAFIFTDIDYRFLKEFEHFILARGCKKSTAHFYMRTLRATINEAIRRGYMDREHYPFDTQFKKDGYSFAHLKGDYNPKPLSMDELERFKKFPVHEHLYLENTYDLFMFILRARGINFVDVCELKKENIVGNRLNYIRAKTGKLYSIKITPEMREIIDKYKGEEYLFPIMDNASTEKTARYHHTRKALKVFNDQLKEIAKILGIEKKVTSYTARYSYTNILVKNNVSVPIIQQALGHANIATTQHYIQKFSNEEVDKVDLLI
ncbi:MAG: site-specific integrase [Bacteroidota bacterium]